MFKVNNRNTRKSFEIYSKLTMKIAQYVNYIVSCVFMVTLNIFYTFPILTLNR